MNPEAITDPENIPKRAADADTALSKIDKSCPNGPVSPVPV